MKILQITADYPPNPRWGMGWHVHSLRNGLINLGNTVYVATASKSHKFHKDIITIHPQNDDKRFSEDLTGFINWEKQLAKKVIKKAKTHTFDVIHCHNWMSWHTAQTVAQKTDSKIVVSLHFLQKQYDSVEENPVPEHHEEIIEIEQEILSKSHAIIVFNQNQKDFLLGNYSLDKRKVCIIPQAIELPPMTLSEIHKKRESKQTVDITFVGRVVRDKGVLDLINIVYKLKEEIPQLRLNIVGEGDLDDDISSMKYSFINQTGYVDRNELAMILSNSDIFCLPSSTETFGLSAIEAMYYGLPVVFSSGPHMPKLFKDKVNGLSVPLKKNKGKYHINKNELHKSLKSLLVDKEKRERIGDSAYKYSHKMYTIKSMSQKTLDLYLKINNKNNA